MLIITALRRHLFEGAAGSIFRATIPLATGNILVRLIGLASMPLLTRLYAPSDYGVLAVFAALLVLGKPLLTLQYAYALLLPRQDGAALNVMALAFCALLVMTSLLAAGMIGLGDAFFGLLSVPILATYWWLIVLGVAGTSIYEIMAMWATRKRAYRVIAGTQVRQTLLGAVIKIGLGLAGLTPIGLVVGQIAARAGGTGTLVRIFLSDLRQGLRHVRVNRMVVAAARYASFPLYSLPANLLLILSVQAPLLVTSTLYGAETAGQLGLAMMVLTVPTLLFEGTSARAFQAEASAIGTRRHGQIREMAVATMIRLGFLSLVPALTLVVFGPFLFSLVFGTQWIEAGHLAAGLAIHMFFQIVHSPAPHILQMFEASRSLMLINLLRLTLTLTIFAVAYLLDQSVLVAICAYAFASAFHSLLSIFVALRLLERA